MNVGRSARLNPLLNLGQIPSDLARTKHNTARKLAFLFHIEDRPLSERDLLKKLSPFDENLASFLKLRFQTEHLISDLLRLNYCCKMPGIASFKLDFNPTKSIT